MFSFGMKFVDDTKKVEQAVERTAFKNFGHAAASVRKEAVASVERSAEPSPPGKPVHTRRGLARRAILFAADKDSAVVGFVASKVDQAMSAHEHGKRYKGTKYPERPTMGPALEKNLDRFAAGFAGSINRQ